MKKYKVGQTYEGNVLGYCLVEGEEGLPNNINTLEDLLGISFKTTTYARNEKDSNYSDIRVNVEYPSYKISEYIKSTTNHQNALAWSWLCIDDLKSMKFYKVIDINRSTIHLGLKVSLEELQKMQDKKIYKTFHASSQIAFDAYASYEEFEADKINDVSINLFSDSILLNECRRRGLINC